MKNIKIITVYSIIALLALCPFGAIASAETAAGGTESSELDAVVTKSEDEEDKSESSGGSATNAIKVTLMVTVVSSQNSRYLGGVKITFKSQNNVSKFSPLYKNNTLTTTDPPPSGGYKIEQFQSGKYEIIAERKGYKIYDEIVEIQSEKSIAELEIEMTPAQGTPEVNEDDITDFQDTMEDYYSDLYSGNLSNSLYNNYTNGGLYSASNNSSVFNTYATYPQFQTNNGYPTSQFNQNYTGSQYGYTNQQLANQQIANQYTGLSGNTSISSLTSNQTYFDSSAYRIQTTTNGSVYLVSRTNQLDNRQLSFVDRGDGGGGVVFFQSDPYSNYSSSLTGSWFITLYTRSESGQIEFSPSIFTKTPITPKEYASRTSQQIIDQFTTTD